MDDRTSTFQEHRPKLYGIAYRMLGTKADAEDTLQDAYLRWYQADTERVRSPEAWLTTTVAHLCIDRLRSERTKRELYIGPWLPEPLVGNESTFAEPASSDSDLSIAFLVMLERLAPTERAAFLLHDVFDYDYPEISTTLHKSEAAVRQIVHRARQRVQREQRRFRVSKEAHDALLERFLAALRTADRGALLELFAEDATWTADGGGKVAAARKVLHGATSVTKLVAGVGRHLAAFAGRVEFHLVPINGETGILTLLDGHLFIAISLLTNGSRIEAGFAILNPDKLAQVPPEVLRRPSSSVTATSQSPS